MPKRKNVDDSKQHDARVAKRNKKSTEKSVDKGSSNLINDDKPSHPSSPSSFLNQLNFDIRMMIYEYLTLPPRHAKDEATGVVLSCKQAYNETAEAAVRQVKKVVNQYQASISTQLGMQITTSDTPLHDGFGALKKLVVNLPVQALDTISINTLASILVEGFDQVTFLYTGTPQEARALMSRRSLEDFWQTTFITHRQAKLYPWIRSIIHVVILMVKLLYKECHGWMSQTEPDDAVIREIPRLAKIQTATIVIAWDLREPPEAANSDESRRIHVLQGSQFNCIQFATPSMVTYLYASYYELIGQRGLVGKCILQSSNRWTRPEYRKDSMETNIDPHRPFKVGNVSSRGVLAEVVARP